MDIIKNAKRIVLKVGTSTLTHDTGKFNLHRIDKLARVLSDFRNAGKEIILVSSGAMSAGAAKLRIDYKPASIMEKQAIAAVGQTQLMRIYDQSFAMYGQTVGQILLTKYIIDHETTKENAQNTFNTLLKMGCLPIVNENDSVAFDEIKVGDNDTLSAYVALICHADALIILSDTDGFYDSDPRTNPGAKLIRTVEKIDETILSCAGGAGTDRGTGGSLTKLNAANIVCSHGIPMFIINGENPDILYDMLEGRAAGTYFTANQKETM